jgi:hydroxyacylglutathione hydrolase
MATGLSVKKYSSAVSSYHGVGKLKDGASINGHGRALYDVFKLPWRRGGEKMQIVNNVFQLSGYDFGTVTSMFAVRGKDSLVIVEAGGQNDLEVARNTMEYWGLSKYPVSHVFITHSHYDHIENALTYRKNGAKIIAIGKDADAIESADDRVIDYGPFYKEKVVPCPVDIRLKDGDVFRAADHDFEVILFPGHTDGSYFLKLVVDGKTIYFTGDIERAYYKDDFRGARLSWSGGSDYDRKTSFESIKKISNLRADILLPSHGQKTLVDGWKILKGMYLRALLDWRGPSIQDEYKWD